MYVYTYRVFSNFSQMKKISYITVAIKKNKKLTDISVSVTVVALFKIVTKRTNLLVVTMSHYTCGENKISLYTNFESVVYSLLRSSLIIPPL